MKGNSDIVGEQHKEGVMKTLIIIVSMLAIRELQHGEPA